MLIGHSFPLGLLLAPIPLRDPVSSASHFFWCFFALFAGLFLIRLSRGNRLKVVGLSIFTASMVVLYFASALYHAVVLPESSLYWFRQLDQSAIYLLIAGSYTPVVLVLMTGTARTFLLSAVWGLALVGIVCKWLLPGVPYPVAVGIYIAMGWVGVLQLPALVRGLGYGGLRLALLGGLFYTLGGVGDVLHWPVLLPGIVGPHEVHHLWDMAGTTVHIAMMLLYVVPKTLPAYDPTQILRVEVRTVSEPVAVSQFAEIRS